MISLTQKTGAKQVKTWVNPENIERILPMADGSTIIFVSGSYAGYEETPEEIAKKIE